MLFFCSTKESFLSNKIGKIRNFISQTLFHLIITFITQQASEFVIPRTKRGVHTETLISYYVHVRLFELSDTLLTSKIR